MVRILFSHVIIWGRNERMVETGGEAKWEVGGGGGRGFQDVR